MMADCNRMAGQADQANLYYRHNSGIRAYSENYTQKEFRPEPESIGVSKKNQGGFSNLGYMCLRMGLLTGLE